MKAVVFHKIGDIRLEDVPEPKIKDQYDAIIQLTASAICGTDLHFVRGTVPNMVPGTILGHEGVGVIQEVGKGRPESEEGRPGGRSINDRMRRLLVLPRRLFCAVR